jgi:hypothetical protein
MQNKEDIISRLAAYAADHIHKLAKKDLVLRPLDELATTRLGHIITDNKPMTDKEAASYIIITSNIDDFPGYNFSPDLRRACFEIIFQTLDIAADTHSTNAHMVQVAQYLHPLLSQDDATISIGWDLVEYMDWYFADDLTTAERKKGYDNLMQDWIPVRKYAENKLR